MMTQYRRFFRNQPESKGDADQAAYSVCEHAELWKKLLADKRFPQTKFSFGNPSMSIGQLTAIVMELVSTKGSAAPSFEPLGNLGIERLTAICKRRTEARLAGKPDAEIPGFPDAATIDESARNLLIGKVLESEPGKVRASLDAMSDAELLALGTVFENIDSEQGKELRKKLAPTLLTVDRILGAPDGFPLAPGKIIDVESAKVLLEYCKSAAA
jgi:hypothetical protein